MSVRDGTVTPAWVTAAALEAGGIALDQPGVVWADAVEAGSASQLEEAIGRHRPWDR